MRSRRDCGDWYDSSCPVVVVVLLYQIVGNVPINVHHNRTNDIVGQIIAMFGLDVVSYLVVGW